MSKNKNQHYVPKCYLQNFSINNQGPLICLFNIKNEKLIPKAPTKTQCSSNYLYGNDNEWEEIIQFMEGSFAKTMRNLNLTLPPTQLDITILKKFWLLQYLRTDSKARSISLTTIEISNLFEKMPEDMVLSHKESVQLNMNIFAKNFEIIDDLKVCLVINKTKIPFITSDNPAILTNKWWHLKESIKDFSFGLHSSGAIFFYPLSPTLLLLGYDKDVYNANHCAGIIHLKKSRDVEAFNHFQILNCDENLYTNSPAYLPLIKNTYIKCKDRIPSKRYEVKYFSFIGRDSYKETYREVKNIDPTTPPNGLITFTGIHPAPLIWPQQVAFRSNGSVYMNASQYVRKSHIKEKDLHRTRKISV